MLEAFLHSTGPCTVTGLLARSSHWWTIAEDPASLPRHILAGVTIRPSGFEKVLSESQVQRHCFQLCIGFLLHWIETKGHSEPVGFVLPKQAPPALRIRPGDRIWVATETSALSHAVSHYVEGSMRRADHALITVGSAYWLALSGDPQGQNLILNQNYVYRTAC